MAGYHALGKRALMQECKSADLGLQQGSLQPSQHARERDLGSMLAPTTPQPRVLRLGLQRGLHALQHAHASSRSPASNVPHRASSQGLG